MSVTNRLPDVRTNSSSLVTETTSLDIQITLPGVKAGIVEAANVHVRSCDAPLATEIGDVCTHLRSLCSVDSLPHAEQIREVRKMFRAWGGDPSRYRPSSEALIRRVLKGEAFPRVSNIVDIANLCAIEMGWPYGCYDYGKLSGPIEIRRGKANEQYDGIGRPLFRLEDRPVFADAHGPFGSPVSDSRRTMVTGSTRELFAIICAPASSCDSVLEEAISRLVKRLVLWCGANGVQTRIVGPASIRLAPF
jgi:DNA/RNA-binding domain of Phe-tRNA-synthetase-like protein